MSAQPSEDQLKGCAKCGACTPVCPVYRASGNEIYSARGKQHLAQVFDGAQASPVFEDIYSKCLLCGACSMVCPRKIDIAEEVISSIMKNNSIEEVSLKNDLHPVDVWYLFKTFVNSHPFI